MGGDAASRTDDPILAAARAFERDRYLTALRVQGDARGDLLTLAAFFAELQRIPAFVNEPMMGEIRFQWWRDAVVSGAS
ncbi:MAG: squalene/phytoene synthase family protein, partial [Pseudomonadota bacterium]